MSVSDLLFDKGGSVYNVLASGYGVTGDGSTNDRNALNTLANSTVPSGGATLVFPLGTYYIGSNLTLPSYASLWIQNGGKLKPANGVTITINGPLAAGPYQIFDVTAGGTIAFGASSVMEEVLAEWWGAVGNDSTDSTAAWGAAYAAAKARNIAIPVLGLYKITDTLTWDGQVSIRGRGRANSPDPGCGFKKYGNFVGIQIDAGAEQCEYRAFKVDSDGGTDASNGVEVNNGSAAGLALRDLFVRNQGGHGIVLIGAALSVYENIGCDLNAGDGFRIAPTGGSYVNANQFVNITCNSNSGVGFNAIECNANIGTNIVVQNNDGDGFQLTSGIANVFIIYAESNGGYEVDIAASSAIRNLLIITNSSGATTVRNLGANTFLFDLSNLTWAGMAGIGAPRKGDNTTGSDFFVSGGSAGSGGTGRTGGTLLLFGGNAAGDTTEDGGIVRIKGGEGTNGGGIGSVAIQPAGDQVVIGAEGVTNLSALVDLVSTSKALLLTRMTTSQRNAISSPADGMLIYNTSTATFQGRQSGSWQNLI